MKKIKTRTMWACGSCSADTDPAVAKKQKWYTGICPGLIAMFAALVYILVTELTH